MRASETLTRPSIWRLFIFVRICPTKTEKHLLAPVTCNARHDISAFGETCRVFVIRDKLGNKAVLYRAAQHSLSEKVNFSTPKYMTLVPLCTGFSGSNTKKPLAPVTCEARFGPSACGETCCNFLILTHSAGKSRFDTVYNTPHESW